MPITQFRGSQFKNLTIQQVNINSGYVDLSSDQAIDGVKTLTKALKTAVPKDLTSADGVINLTDHSNLFIVDGAEMVSRITGWAQGAFSVQWKQKRTLKNVVGYFELQGGNDRYVNAGDFSSFVFMTPSQVVETGYFGTTNNDVAQAGATSLTVTTKGVDTIPLVAVPDDSSMMLVFINGGLQNPTSYTITNNSIVFDFKLSKEDWVYAYIMAKATVPGGIAVDGGTF